VTSFRLRPQVSGGWIDATPADDASYKEADRHWFEAHRRRSFHIRRAIAGEPLPAGDVSHIVVKQIKPGLREKLFLYVPDGPTGPTEIPDVEHVAIAICQLLECNLEEVPLTKIREFASSLARAEPEATQ
jgi:hypothetical protein